ncbi:nitroreductase family protein [Methanosphaera sp. WGK6]|uniref:nitroreductase family protein n=1 Tax=Methanosphaera sp. WGK6 TaxID=1561964 RepID=UPI00084C21B4|nr:nitroreductase family protein [Methanosphaera sp. WGK6]OED30363.1 hypothetical protein NL43_03030 [Methanosphaera sp. WGK6]
MKDADIILNNIYNRKSVRKFTADEVNNEDLIKVLRAGSSAPSTLNLQPWHFIVFKNSKTLKSMADIHEYSKMFNEAKAGIIVAGDINKTLKGAEEFWIQDCAAATENILLAIEALNLGAVWTGIYPIEERFKKLADYFNLPSNIIPFSLIAIGHPDGPQNVLDKWNESRIHWETWD